MNENKEFNMELRRNAGIPGKATSPTALCPECGKPMCPKCNRHNVIRLSGVIGEIHDDLT